MVKFSFHFVQFIIMTEKAWLCIFRFCCFIPMKNFAIKRKNSNKKHAQYYTGTSAHTPQHMEYYCQYFICDTDVAFF